LTIEPTTATNNKKFTENTVTISLAAWMAFDQLSCNFKNNGGVTPHAPTNPSLVCTDRGCEVPYQPMSMKLQES